MQILTRFCCPTCNGKKRINNDECSHCKGEGKVLSSPRGESEHVIGKTITEQSNANIRPHVRH